MTKFFVEVNGQNQGPYDLPTLQEKLARGEVSADSRLFDPQISDWITVKAFIAMCAEVSQNANHRPDVKAPSSAVTSTLPAVDTDEWFVLKGENKYGPYTYLDIIKLVQE
ncbi:MAG: DUF4339 domain-containing protein, partial [Oligoflexia bacterium]|nr:DUF4339 domain-containing protein [Oligoflexia bacterium]